MVEGLGLERFRSVDSDGHLVIDLAEVEGADVCEEGGGRVGATKSRTGGGLGVQ